MKTKLPEVTSTIDLHLILGDYYITIYMNLTIHMHRFYVFYETNEKFLLERGRDPLNSSTDGSDECESGRDTRQNYMTDTEMSTTTDNHYYRSHSNGRAVIPFQHYGSFYLRMGAVGLYNFIEFIQ